MNSFMISYNSANPDKKIAEPQIFPLHKKCCVINFYVSIVSLLGLRGRKPA